METDNLAEGRFPATEDLDSAHSGKRKMGHGGAAFSDKVSNPPRFEAWMRSSAGLTEEGSKPKSYKESLLAKSKWRDSWFFSGDEVGGDASGTGAGSGVGVGFEEVLDIHSGISVDLSDPMCPKFLIDDKERERLCKPFAKSLFVKLLGGSMSLYFLESKLNQIWARKGAIKLGDLENEFFVVSFQEWEDYERALTGGPWVISDKYLCVMRWRPGFNPKKEKIDKIAAWVRFPEIEAELFDKKILYNLASSIGQVLKLDVHTASRGRNKFARVCIELDLTKPLVPHYMVDGVLKHVEYESLHALCLNCGLFGHFQESCVHGKRDHSEGGKVVFEGSVEMEEGEIAESSKEAVGPWRVVQRIRRQRGSRSVNEDVKISSRYDVLHEEDVQVQGVIAPSRGPMMGDSNGRQFIKRRDKGPRQPVIIRTDSGPLPEVKNVPKRVQHQYERGERSKQGGNLGSDKGHLIVPVLECRGEGNGQVKLPGTDESMCG